MILAYVKMHSISGSYCFCPIICILFSYILELTDEIVTDIYSYNLKSYVKL